MSGSIFFDGKRFVSAGEAAEASDFTRDYVGKLCREGKVSARRVGKQWFVDFESFQKFLEDQARAHEERRTALSHERTLEYQKKSVQPEPEASAGRSAITIAPHAALALASRAKDATNRSKELLDRVFVASTSSHIPDSTLRALSTTAYAVTPIAEIAHRFLALVLAFSLAFGVYGLVNPSAARIALSEVRDETLGLEIHLASVASVANAVITGRYDDQFVALVENPHVAAASMSASASFAMPGTMRSFIGSIKSKIAGLFFWRHGTQVADVAPSIAPSAPKPPKVAVAPELATTSTTHAPDASPAPVKTVSERAPIIERIVTNVISPTGVSQDVLDSRLQALEKKFSEMLYMATQVAPMPPAAGGIVNTIALTNRIDHLERTDISDPTITGGTIDGTTLTNVDISANSFTVSGLSSLATTTISGDLTLGGTLRFTGSSSTISAVGGIFDNATSTNLYAALFNADTGSIGEFTATNATTTNATSTNLFAENASTTNASTTNGYISNLAADRGAVGEFTATNGTTTNATSTNLFASLGRFTSGIFDTLTATFASITGLTVTDSTTTNATTTHSYIQNLASDAGSITNFTSIYGTTTNATSTNQYATSLNAGNATFGVATSYGLLTAPNFSATSTSATSSFAGNLSVGGLTSLATTTITGSLTLSGSQTSNALTTTGDVTVGGNLTVNGNTITLGTTTSNLLVINSAINSNLVPSGNKVFDLGSPSFFWRNGFIDTLNVNNLSAASSSIGGTASETFTLNSDNATADAQDMNLVFYRGTVVPNAVLSWNSAADKKRFEFNQALFIANQSGSTTQPTLKLKGVSGQTGNILEIASSSGSTMFAIAADGSTSISTSTVTSLTAGTTTLTNLSVTNTNTSSFAGNLSVGGNLTIGGTTNNTGLSTFLNASTSLLSVTNKAYFGGTSTTTIDLTGAITVTSASANTFPFASTTALTVSGQANIGSFAGASVSSLTNSYVPKWNSAAGIFGNSLIYDNGTQIGIGTNSNLSGALTANGTFGVQAEGDVFRQYDAGDAAWYPIIARYNTNNGSFPASTFIFGNGANARVGFEVPGGGNLTTFQVKSLTSWFNGNVGIGTTTPSQKLSIAGTVETSGSTGGIVFSGSGSPGGTYASSSSWLMYQNSDRSLTIGRDGHNPAVIFGHDGSYSYSTNGSPVFYIDSQGRTGIGTTLPSRTLEVAGSGIFTGGDVTASTFTATSSVTANSLQISNIASSLVVTDGSGNASAYGGTSCTNQFVRSINGTGVATCASITNSDIANGTIDLTTKVTGILPVLNGGTGTNTSTGSGSVVLSASPTLTGTLTAGAANFSGNVGIGLSNPSQRLGVGSINGQTNAFISARGNGNNIEFGHANTAGYGSTIGSEVTSGTPFICFSCEAGSTANTYLTRGIKGSVISSDLSGGIQFSTLSTASADNQTKSNLLTVSSAGNLTFSASSPTITSGGSYITIPNGLYLSSGTLYVTNQAQFRGGIHNDTGAYLELDGGTSGNTYVNGNLGIGTTTPFTKLAVTNTVSGAQASIAYDATRYAQLQTDASGDFHINPSGQDMQLDDSNFWVCAGGACPAGTPTGTGNAIVENKIGVGVSNPSTSIDVAQNGALKVGNAYFSSGGDSVNIANNEYYNGSSWVTNGSAGALLQLTGQGVNFYTHTTTGAHTSTMSITSGGTIAVNAGGQTTMGLATSTFNGDIKIAGKLDVGTIDPPYTIDGIKYATYGESMTGVHEETTQTVELAEKNADGKYAYTINFDDQKQGSDLWLFYQVTDFGAKWQDLVVLLTPSFEGQVYYKKIPEKHEIVVYADQPGEVSMRLTGDRYDFSKWHNIRPDQDGDTTGTHVLTSKPSVQTAAAASALDSQ